MVACATIPRGTPASHPVLRRLVAIPIVSAILLASSPASSKTFTSDDSDYHRAGQFALVVPVLSAGIAPGTSNGPQRSHGGPGLAGVLFSVMGLRHSEDDGRRGGAVSALVVSVLPPCATPAVVMPPLETGLVALPGTPGVAGGFPRTRHALLGQLAFLHGCESAAVPCTGFDAVSPIRAGRPRSIPRLSLMLAARPVRRAQWTALDAPSEIVVRDYVDVAELLSIERWHGSVMAPLVRVAVSVEAGASVVVADAAPGRLDIGNAEDLDILDVVGGWFRRVPEREMLALLALGLAPVGRRTRSPTKA